MRPDVLIIEKVVVMRPSAGAGLSEHRPIIKKVMGGEFHRSPNLLKRLRELEPHRPILWVLIEAEMRHRG